MAGESEQEKQAKRNQGDIDAERRRMSSFNPKISNRYNDYQNRFDKGFKMPFDYANMAKQLNQVYSQDIGRVNSQAATDTMRAGRGAAGRLGNAGITKGSLFNEAVAGAGQPIASAKYNTLSDLSRNRNANDINLMQMENENKYNNWFNTTKAASDIDFAKLGGATNVDLENIMNQLRKSGVINSLLGTSMANTQNFDDTTWLDDVLGIANTAAQFIPK